MQSFVSASGVTEQAEIPARIIAAMPNPSVQEQETAIHEVTIGAGRTQFLADLGRQLHRDSLIGIEDEHPLVLPGNLLQGPVLFLRKPAIPLKVDHFGATGRSQLSSTVSRT